MTSRTEGYEELSLPELQRRVANIVRHGHISAVDHAKRRVRVTSGEIETAWLPWSAGRAAAGKRRWDPPEVGEQVTMIAPTGDLRQASVIPGLYQDAHDAPSSDPNKDKTEYSDGAVLEYDRGTHTLTADLQSDTSIVATRTSIKARRGDGSVEVTNAKVTAAVGAVKIEISPSSIKVTIGSTTQEWTSSGTTLATPAFTGVQT